MKMGGPSSASRPATRRRTGRGLHLCHLDAECRPGPHSRGRGVNKRRAVIAGSDAS
ncbi:protein of unknown function [Methylorubrum extorquens DM4]|uniref:Uncharacterized protein n=1 Tax=Methylorubrum extorquens (strain DSM 6343 / CIP 106787 / DM4) TaxID=661410 RepID=C7CFY0_METED|nr:protein of unknown function [Methylorubrum extorquens DM4]